MGKRKKLTPEEEQRLLEEKRLLQEHMKALEDMNANFAVSLDGHMENEFIGQDIEEEGEEWDDDGTDSVLASMSNMEYRRVLLVNTVAGTGSVGRLVVGLAQALENNGYEVLVAYGRGEAPEGVSSVRIGQDMDVYVHGAMSRLTDRHGFYSTGATREFIKVIEDYRPDIIHLHNVHGYYLNIAVLFDYLRTTNIRVIWTLHDCWSFTGHCSHFEYIGCMKWQTECKKCEQLAEYPRSFFADNSQSNFHMKRELFTGMPNLTIVTPSLWLASRVAQSFMAGYHRVVVPTGIDLNNFYPMRDEMYEEEIVTRLRDSLGLRGRYILLGVANPWRERKGLEQFKNLAKMISDRYAIVLLGLSDKQVNDLPDSIIGLARTDSVEELAALYSLADVYVNLTLEDTFPTTNIEALACGTPVVTFRSGGSAESIDDTCGIAVDKNSIQGVLAAVDTIIRERDHLYTTAQCVEHAALYDKEVRFNEYIRDVYEGI